MSPAGLTAGTRVLAVGSDTDVCVALHLHLAAGGHQLFCVPTPGELDAFLRAVAPQVVVLMLPAAPDASWGVALTSASAAARVGVRVVVVAPSREVVEPLAAVAGAERALSRAEVLSRPLLVVERMPQPPRPGAVPPAGPPPAPPPPAQAAPAGSPPPYPPPGAVPPPMQPFPPPAPRRPPADLMALIDEELVDEPQGRPQLTRVEVNVSLVSEHNFFVGQTRRLDSGGVFISTALPPPPGTRLQLRLGLPDGRKLDLEGEVAFVREKSAITGRQPSGCGVRLKGLPTWAVDAIDRFILARPPIFYTAR